MVKITCVGELLMDMIGKEQRNLAESSFFLKRPGGAPANVAVAASRMGADVSMIATVGEDDFGDKLIEKMEEEGIGTEHISRIEEKTSLAFAALDEDASPHFSFYRGADERISREQLEGIESDILHVGSLPFTSREASENIFSALEAFEGTVSFDPNVRPELMSDSYRKRLEKMLEYTDIVFAAGDEIEFFGGLEEILVKVSTVLVTRGSDGAELVTEEDSLDVSPPEVDVVDTTGAGDAFTGAYLACIDEEREEALQVAVDAAAQSTTDKGAMSALPYRKELG